jgi:hypothetical protein
MSTGRISSRPMTGLLAVMFVVAGFAACGGQTSGGRGKTDSGSSSSSGAGSGSGGSSGGSSGSGSGGAGADGGLDGSQSLFGDSALDTGLDASCIALYQPCTLTSVCCLVVPAGASCVADMCLPNHGM